MASVNIRRDVQDSFYRYKMPKLLSKIEGKGNGIKTVIPNMSEISKALNRPPSYATKFFGCELGAQVKCDEVNAKYIVNGAHDASRLQNLLDSFIQKFVLCGECSNPETEIVLNNNEIIRDCKACGKRTLADMRHKLVTFILKNPPTSSNATSATTSSSTTEPTATPALKASGKQKKNGKRGVRGNGSTLSGAGDEGAEDDDEEDGDEVPDAADTLGAEVDAMDKESVVDVALEIADPKEDLAEYAVSNVSATHVELQEVITNLGIRQDKAVAVLAQVLLTGAILTKLPQKKLIFSKLILDEKCQRAFLGGLERLVGVMSPDLLDKMPTVLKYAYDHDLVSEDVLIEWAVKPEKKYVPKDVALRVREKTALFIRWLQDAEEESDEDD